MTVYGQKNTERSANSSDCDAAPQEKSYEFKPLATPYRRHQFIPISKIRNKNYFLALKNQNSPRTRRGYFDGEKR